MDDMSPQQQQQQQESLSRGAAPLENKRVGPQLRAKAQKPRVKWSKRCHLSNSAPFYAFEISGITSSVFTACGFENFFLRINFGKFWNRASSATGNEKNMW